MKIDQHSSVSHLFTHKDLPTTKIVSFDFFDTLVYRNSITHYQLWRSVSFDYFVVRLVAEKLARTLNRIRGIPEISHSDLYRLLPKKWGLQFETDLELKNLVENSINVDLMRKAISSGARVCVISDTHFPRAHIAQFMRSLGMPEVEIFVSGEYRLTKSTGLMLELQKSEGFQFKDWVHVGDNIYSDIFAPSQLGIHTIYYPRLEIQLLGLGLVSPKGYRFLRKSKRDGNLAISWMFGLLIELSKKSNSELQTMPEILGAIMSNGVASAISDEIHQLHLQNRYDRILYSSRDGWLPFTSHLRKYPNDPIQYFKTSRTLVKDENFNAYLKLNIGSSKKVLLYDLGWRGSSAKSIQKGNPDISWHFVYWQLLGKSATNQFQLNPGGFINRFRTWRSRDFLESIFTDNSEGYDKFIDSLVPCERAQKSESTFKEPILKGTSFVTYSNANTVSLHTATLILECFSRFPSINLIRFAREHIHEVDEDIFESLVLKTWKEIFSRRKVLWPFGSRLLSENMVANIAFESFVFLKELSQRTMRLGKRLKSII